MKHYIGDNVKNLQQHDSPDDQSPAPDLIVALRQLVQGPPRQMDGGPIMAAGAAALVGQMPSCHLGKDKIKRFKKWKDWLGDAKNKMAFLGISTDQQKVNFLRSCGGSDFTEFGEKEAHIRFTAVPADPDQGIAALDAHKYNEIIDESKKSMPTLISRDRAITDLLRIEQGNRSFMDFLAVVEDQEYLCRTDEDRITGDDLKRISLIAGMKDRTLAEKAIAEEYNLQQVIQAGVNRESSIANVEAMQARPTSTISRLDDTDTHADSLDAKIHYLQEELDAVRCVWKHGKYSSRYKPDSKTGMSAVCHKCTYNHSEGRCPADGCRCNACGQEGHFKRSMLCKARSFRTKLRTARLTKRRRLQVKTARTNMNQSRLYRQNMPADAGQEWPRAPRPQAQSILCRDQDTKIPNV